MVRENRIKDYIFSAVTVNGSTFTSYCEARPINGELLKVRVQGVSSPGSIWIAESGTNVELWKRNNVTSGLATFDSYPFVYGVNGNNTTGSPQAFYNLVTNEMTKLCGSGFTSGTGTTFGPVTLYYR